MHCNLLETGTFKKILDYLLAFLRKFDSKLLFQGPVIIEEVSFIRKITYNIHETYNWISKGSSHVFQYVPDVKTPIKKTVDVVSGILFSVLILFSPTYWWSKLPKISRKRVRRRKRKSRGPPTRFSARLRNLPVQFTGELPKRTRRRRIR